MAKKTRRAKRKARKRARTYQPIPLVAEKPAAAAAAPSPRPTAARVAAAQTVDFREEYKYVLADLKRIGITAAAMLGVMIVLALIIR